MRIGLSVGLVAGWIAIATGEVQGGEDARAIIDRAIEAQGGEAKLARIQVAGLKVKGAFVVGDTQCSFTGEAFYQLPSLYKQVIHLTIGDETMTQTIGYDSNKVWVQLGEQMLDIGDDLRAELQKGRYVEQVAGLLILKKGYQLSMAGTSRVRDTEAEVVKVTFPGQPDVRLFFDKATGLLVKTEHRQLDPQKILQGIKGEVLQETFYSDYGEPGAIEADERILQEAKAPVDGPGLIKFFRAKTTGGADREKIAALVRQLGDKSFPVREKASKELVALGEFAAPFLKPALKSPDLEVARRAERCLQMIQADPAKKEREKAIMAAAVRLLAAKRPAGAVAAMLAFLPLASDEGVERETRAAINALAIRNGQPDQTLIQALESKDPVCQSAAAEALGKVPLPPGRKIIVEGVKRPMKAAVYRDGKLFMKWEALEVTYFNKLDDKLFAKP
jgi:hypothetical protein